LPRKILKEMKKIHYYLKKREYTFNSDFTKRNSFNLTIAIAVLMFLSDLMLAQAISTRANTLFGLDALGMVGATALLKKIKRRR
jgi:hypothetical protein